MYDVPYFKEPDQDAIKAFMKAHSFATLIGCHDETPVATQVPLLFEEVEGKLLLRGHIMRQTDHHKAFVRNENVLCIFTGAQSYVSAQQYNDQQTASTWNYLTVQASGKLRFLPAEELIHILRQTTATYEGDPASPSNFDHLPEEYVAKLAKAIEGFEIEVMQLRHVFKLSQNKTEAEYSRIIQRLEKGSPDEQAVASAMKAKSSRLFQK